MENINLSNGLQKVIDICMKTLDKFTPRKKKNSRGSNPAGNYMFKAKNRNTRTRCEIYSKLTINTPEQ